MKKIIMILIAALLIPSGLVFAAPYYDVGDQFLAITAGPTTPILYNSEGENVIGPGFGEKGKMAEMQTEKLEPLQKKVMETISKYAADNQYGLVLDIATNPMVIYYNPEADKTQEIVTLLK